MAIRNREIQEAEQLGQTWFSGFRKVSALATTQGIWCDLSMATGNPRPNYYVGTELGADVLNTANGIWHGGDVSPKKKILQNALIGSFAATVTPATFLLCDYLLFYSLVDMDSTDEQLLSNAVTLPRYASGEGVQMFLVATNPFIGGQSFTVKYTNSEGVSGRQTVPIQTATTTNIATIINSGAGAVANRGPFIPLNMGDRGVRSVESITFFGPNGGLAALVLVKPLATMYTREIITFSERDFFREKGPAPIIEDGAYLNWLCCPNGSAAAVPIVGNLNFVWM
jgi:hypothetical protein